MDKQLEEILLELTKKRGKHSSLWMWPKTESLTEAQGKIKQLFRTLIEKAEPKDWKDYWPGSNNVKSNLAVIVPERVVAYNLSKKQYKRNLLKEIS